MSCSLKLNNEISFIYFNFNTKIYKIFNLFEQCFPRVLLCNTCWYHVTDGFQTHNKLFISSLQWLFFGDFDQEECGKYFKQVDAVKVCIHTMYSISKCDMQWHCEGVNLNMAYKLLYNTTTMLP